LVWIVRRNHRSRLRAREDEPGLNLNVDEGARRGD